MKDFVLASIAAILVVVMMVWTIKTVMDVYVSISISHCCSYMDMYMSLRLLFGALVT